MRQLSKINARTVLLALLVIAFACTTAVWAQTSGQHLLPPASAPEQQKGFATPQIAADELIAAAEKYDVPALLEIFGPQGQDFIASADPINDKHIAGAFVEKAHEKHSVRVNNTQATLFVGEEDWPLPIPIVKRQGKWFFDTKAGRNEILARRIGANELDAIQICRGYVEAQMQYASTTHDDSHSHEYAQKIFSTPGKQDGLFWRNADGAPGGPISEGVARAIEQGYKENGAPYHGYYFKILSGQGPQAPFGKVDYIIHGSMIGGFALVAFPAEYRVTGVKTFIVNNFGQVYQKDLGPETVKIGKDMALFNPEKGWIVTNDELLSRR